MLDLRQFLASDIGPITIVSPFIKRDALEAAFSLVDADAPVDLFTRWLPIEVAMGVSDLAVFDWARERANARVYLLRELHAKTYLRGTTVAVGSANLTGRGMGWTANPNLELLLTVPGDSPEVLRLLDVLRARSTPATASIRRAIQRAADNIGDRVPLAQLTAAGEQLGGQVSMGQNAPGWIPATSEPRRLFDAYSPSGGMSMLLSTQEDAERDLAFLQVPEGYDRERFIGHVRAVFMQSSVFQVADSALEAGNDVQRTLETDLGLSPDEAAQGWAILAEWLTYFFRDRYRTELPDAAYRIVRSRVVE
jgi:hypothetical protein